MIKHRLTKSANVSTTSYINLFTYQKRFKTINTILSDFADDHKELATDEITQTNVLETQRQHEQHLNSPNSFHWDLQPRTLTNKFQGTR